MQVEWQDNGTAEVYDTDHELIGVLPIKCRTRRDSKLGDSFFGIVDVTFLCEYKGKMHYVKPYGSRWETMSFNLGRGR